MLILLIDDESEVKVFVEQSMPEGSTLHYAASLAEAERLVNMNDYDMIIVDLRIPGTPNGEVLNKMMDMRPSTCVMALTALHFPDYAASLIRQGATAVHFKPDASIDQALAERLLGEAILFTKAQHDNRQEQLLSLSANAVAIERLEREIHELRRDRERLAAIEVQRVNDNETMRQLWVKFEAQQALEASRLAEREQGKWSMWVKIVGLIGTGLAAILGPYAASKWGKP